MGITNKQGVCWSDRSRPISCINGTNWQSPANFIVNYLCLLWEVIFNPNLLKLMLKVQYLFRPKDKHYRAHVAYLNWKDGTFTILRYTASAISTFHCELTVILGSGGGGVRKMNLTWKGLLTKNIINFFNALQHSVACICSITMSWIIVLLRWWTSEMSKLGFCCGFLFFLKIIIYLPGPSLSCGM